MNIFDQLRDIISDKKNKLSEDFELEKDFVPYMTQRWLSFYSNEFAQLLNSSTNIVWKGIEDKSIWYKLFTGILPKSKFKNIKYIKKNKEAKTTVKLDKEIVIYLAERFELSRKEICDYIESGLIDIKTIKKQLQNS